MRKQILIMLMMAFCLDGFAQVSKVKSVRAKRIEVTSQLDAEPDEAAQRVVEQYKVSVDSVMAPVLGQSFVAMTVERPECLLGNWAADMLVETSTATGMPRADLGLMNLGGLRSNMPYGIIHRGDIIEISPFQNYVVVAEMKGKDLLKLFQNVASRYGEGLSHEVRLVADKEGKLVNVTVNGQPVDPKRMYRVATIDYLAEGNDHMTALKKKKHLYPLNMLVRDAMMESIIKNKNITSKLEGRVVVQ